MSGSTRRRESLAASVARRLADEIVARGWPVGEVLGSEPELLERRARGQRPAARRLRACVAAEARRGYEGTIAVVRPHELHVLIAEAVVAGDAPLAQLRMRRHLEAVAPLFVQ